MSKNSNLIRSVTPEQSDSKSGKFKTAMSAAKDGYKRKVARIEDKAVAQKSSGKEEPVVFDNGMLRITEVIDYVVPSAKKD